MTGKASCRTGWSEVVLHFRPTSVPVDFKNGKPIKTIRSPAHFGVSGRRDNLAARAITLTAEGSLYLEQCQRILAEFDVARTEPAHAQLAPHGRLRVGLPQLGMYLIRYFTEFQEHFPEVELELDFSDRLVNVIDEGFDAVMRVGEVEDSRLTIRNLNGYGQILVAAPIYLSEHGRPTRPSDLLNHKCLRYRYPTSGRLASWPLVIRGKAVHLDLPQSAVTNAINPLLAMAEAGLGIALLPDFIAADTVEDGRLIVVLEKYVRDYRRFSILWPSSRQPLPKVKASVDFMVQRLG